MSLRFGFLITALLAIYVNHPARAQEGHGVTPAQIEQGEQLFFTNCSNCHGSEGDSIPGVSLFSGRFRHATTDEDLAKIIRTGIPGTPMPPSNYSEFQTTSLVSYLRAMANVTPTVLDKSNPGDPGRGKSIFDGKGKCLECHRVRGIGSFLGPDLSEIGGSRRSVSLERSLLDPTAEIRAENHTVSITTVDGKTLLGRLLNQDTYSLQMIDRDGSLLYFEKNKIRSFDILTASPMPSYSKTFTSQELTDVVSYLTTLKLSKQ